MHRTHLLLAAVIPGMLLLSALGIFTLTRKSTTLPNVSNLVSAVIAGKPTAGFPIASDGPSATLYKEYGDVSYTLSNGTHMIVSSEEVQIPTNTTVETGVGLAHVVLPDSSMMSISENSKTTVTFTANTTHVLQSIGRTFHRVVSIVSGGSYEVETPTTLATVRGTQFGVDVDDSQESAVYVTESTVEVGQFETSGGGKKLGEKKAVTVGNEMVVPKQGQGKPIFKRMPRTMQNDPWLKRNQKLSETIVKDRPQKEQKVKDMINIIRKEKDDVQIKKLDETRKKDNNGRFDQLHEVPKLPKVEPSPTPFKDALNKVNSVINQLLPVVSPSPTQELKAKTIGNGGVNNIQKIVPTSIPTAVPTTIPNSLNPGSNTLMAPVTITQPAPSPSETLNLKINSGSRNKLTFP